MKVKILKKRPDGVQVQNLENGRIIKYSKQFFKKRCELGIIEVADTDGLDVAV